MKNILNTAKLPALNAQTINIPTSLLNDRPEAYGTFNISGDNYAPYFNDGDTVIISFNLERDNPTNIYLIEFDGKAELRRFRLLDDETVLLEGVTPYIPPIKLEYCRYKVLGFPYMLIRCFDREGAQ